MRQGYSINKASPSLVIHSQVPIGTVMVANPTAVSVLAAIGRTDSPTLDSADFILPGGTIVQLAVNGSDFCFAFASPASLPTPGNTAQISTYTKDEQVSAVGSLSLSGLGSSLVASFDIIESGLPTTPAAGFARLWASVAGQIHSLDLSTGDRTLLDSLGAIIASGGLKITLGGLEVDGGNVGVGTAPVANVGIRDSPALSASGFGAVYELLLDGSLAAAANGDTLYGLYVGPTFTPGAFTGTLIHAVHVAANSQAQASANKAGIFIGSVTGATANNIGLYVDPPSGAAGVNAAIFVAGGGINITGTSIFNSGLSVPAGTAAVSSGLVQLTGLPAFAAGSKYLILDVSGFVRVSAIGPAS